MNLRAMLGRFRGPQISDEEWAPIARALRDMPVPRAPRDFRLSASTAAALRAQAAEERHAASRRANRPRLASALAGTMAAALVLVVVASPRMVPAPVSERDGDTYMITAASPEAGDGVGISAPQEEHNPPQIATDARSLGPCPATPVPSPSSTPLRHRPPVPATAGPPTAAPGCP